MSEQETGLGHLIEEDGIFYLVPLGTSPIESGATAGIVTGAGAGGGPHYTGGTTVNQGAIALGDWQQARAFVIDQDLDQPDMAAIREQVGAAQSHQELVEALGGRQHDGVLVALLLPFRADAPGIHGTATYGDAGEQARMRHGRTETVDKNETITIHGSHVSGDGVDQDDVVRVNAAPQTGTTDGDHLIIPGPHGLTVGKAQEITVGGFADGGADDAQEMALGGPDTTTRQQPGFLALQEATQIENQFFGGDPDRPVIAGHPAAFKLEDVMVSSLTVPAGDGNDQIETERSAHHGPGHEGVIIANAERFVGSAQPFAVQSGAAPPLDTWEHAAKGPHLSGDFDGDGDVDGADFAAARGGDGSLERMSHDGGPRPFIMQDGEIVPRGVITANTEGDFHVRDGHQPLADFNNDGEVDSADFAVRHSDPTKWEGPEFDATKNEVSIESVEIPHEGQSVVNAADYALWRGARAGDPHPEPFASHTLPAADGLLLDATAPTDHRGQAAGIHVAAGDIEGDAAARTEGPGGPHESVLGGRYGDGKLAGLKEPGSVEYPNLAHAQGGEPAHLLPYVEQDQIVSARDIASGMATGLQDGTSNTIMFGEAASDPDDGPSTLLRHAAPGPGAGHDAHVFDMVDPSPGVHDGQPHAMGGRSGDPVPTESISFNLRDTTHPGFTLDGKGTDVNVEEVELLTSTEHQPHEALHNLHIPDAADVLPEHDAGDIGHLHIHHGL